MAAAARGSRGFASTRRPPGFLVFGILNDWRSPVTRHAFYAEQATADSRLSRRVVILYFTWFQSIDFQYYLLYIRIIFYISLSYPYIYYICFYYTLILSSIYYIFVSIHTFIYIYTFMRFFYISSNFVANCIYTDRYACTLCKCLAILTRFYVMYIYMQFA